MELRIALDLLHRRIEEWTEEAMIEPDVSDREVEAFREYGSELVAHLHEAAEQLGAAQRDLFLAEKGSSSADIVEELVEAFVDEWDQLGFGERPAGLELDELREVMEPVADVLEASADEADMELAEATEVLDDFIAGTW